MSRMGDLWIDIMEMVEDGMTDEEIAYTLRIPKDWIDEVRKANEEFNAAMMVDFKES